jgi:hypothetical protein
VSTGDGCGHGHGVHVVYDFFAFPTWVGCQGTPYPGDASNWGHFQFAKSSLIGPGWPHKDRQGNDSIYRGAGNGFVGDR